MKKNDNEIIAVSSVKGTLQQIKSDEDPNICLTYTFRGILSRTVTESDTMKSIFVPNNFFTCSMSQPIVFHKRIEKCQKRTAVKMATNQKHTLKTIQKNPTRISWILPKKEEHAKGEPFGFVTQHALNATKGANRITSLCISFDEMRKITLCAYVTDCSDFSVDLYQPK